MNIHVTMIDIRPLKITVPNLDFLQGDAMTLTSVPDGSLQVLSCLHALEHFGLGRYGDPVDYFGWEKALQAMVRKIAHGGYLYLSVPCGQKEMVMFNAHRIFRPSTLYLQVKAFLDLVQFSAVHDYTLKTWDFSADTDCENVLNQIADDYLGDYDCGIFVFHRKV